LHPLLSASVLVVIGTLLAPLAAFGDEARLPSQVHREVWQDDSGGVIKDFEWTYTPILSQQPNFIDIHVEDVLVKHADNFAGVGGEIDFGTGLQENVELTFNDGKVEPFDSMTAHLTRDLIGERRVVAIAVISRLVGREWKLKWDVDTGFATAQNDLPLVHKGDPPAMSGFSSGFKRGTHLTAFALSDEKQDIDGLWKATGVVQTGGPEQLMRFYFMTDIGKLVLMDRRYAPLYHPDYQPFQRMLEGASQGTLGQYEGVGDSFSGLRSTLERVQTLCPQYRWWDPSVLSFNAPHIHAEETAKDRTHDEKCDMTGDAPDMQASYDRYAPVSFEPEIAGKYMTIVGAPAVGNQAAQFKASVSLSWDYSDSGAAKMVLHVKGPGRGDAPQAFENPKQGRYQLVCDQPGTYQFELQLFEADGTMIHRDLATAVIPSLPGIR
jgi:hypothetical protein